MKVLYPGSFDPLHNGHMEIIELASGLYDEVVVAAMKNLQKGEPLFDLKEREEILNESLSFLPNVRVVVFSELVVDLVKKEKLDLIIKGLRAVSDFENELQMSRINKQISGIETVFLPSTSESSFIASKYIREIAKFGGDVSGMVPEFVINRLKEKTKE